MTNQELADLLPVPRSHLRDDGFPTRQDTSLYTPAETAIREAMLAVEAVGASDALTEAVVLLDRARNLVADHVEAKDEGPDRIEMIRSNVRASDLKCPHCGKAYS
jgi:hypothetical protein